MSASFEKVPFVHLTHVQARACRTELHPQAAEQQAGQLHAEAMLALAVLSQSDSHGQYIIVLTRDCPCCSVCTRRPGMEPASHVQRPCWRRRRRPLPPARLTRRQQQRPCRPARSVWTRQRRLQPARASRAQHSLQAAATVRRLMVWQQAARLWLPALAPQRTSWTPSLACQTASRSTQVRIWCIVHSVRALCVLCVCIVCASSYVMSVKQYHGNGQLTGAASTLVRIREWWCCAPTLLLPHSSG